MPDWYPRFPAKFDHGTLGFTLAERGAYSGLLDQMYLAGEFKVPDDDKMLAALLRCSLDEWLTVSVRVKAKFCKNPETPGFLVHHVVQEKVTDQERRANISRQNGSLGGRPRKLKLKDKPNNNPTGTQQAPSQGPASPPHTERKRDINIDINSSVPETPHANGFKNGNHFNGGPKSASRPSPEYTAEERHEAWCQKMIRFMRVHWSADETLKAIQLKYSENASERERGLEIFNRADADYKFRKSAGTLQPINEV